LLTAAAAATTTTTTTTTTRTTILSCTHSYKNGHFMEETEELRELIP